MSATRQEVQLLQASIDSNTVSDFRVLVNGKSIKYIKIDPGIYDDDDMGSGPIFPTLIPPLPSGEWNVATISKDEKNNGEAYFASASKVDLPCIQSLWHPLRIEYLDLSIGQKIEGRLYEATCPNHFGDSSVILKFARFGWQIPCVQAPPRFLGHILEEGRAIGFILERITDARHAGVEDLDLCQAALSKLHSLGFKHGDVNKHNFLVRNGKTLMIDFESLQKCDDQAELVKEMEKLKESLADTSGIGGVGPATDRFQ
ncbi:MAG: hypothetical protein M1819_004150 [Sarea resinae]|nr:MAG: hypothetical protein M1819_004150 [Sarea resinae]